MRKITSLAILSLMWLSGVAAFAQEDHGYENGLCTMHDNCPQKFEEPQKDADGYYMLYNAGNVEWISDQVAAGFIDPYCKLMNDIDFQGIENLHRPIGPDNGKKYNGTFDGQGHRILNMIINLPSRERVGFFGSLRGNPNNSKGEGTVVKNLIIDKSCHIIGGKRTAGIVGSGQNNEREILIMNCVNEATIESPSNNAAGILGGSDSTHPIWKITNCVNAGKIISTNEGHEAAGISSWAGDNGNTRVTNCINVGEIDGMDAAGHGVARLSDYNANRIINSYDFSGNEAATQGMPWDYDLEYEDLETGKLAYYMNSNIGSVAFYQTIGEDAYPVPFSTSRQVYLQGELNCDGTPLEGGTYTNDLVTPVIPDHEYDEGDWHCINCGHISDSFCQIADGFYQLNTPVDLCWFAEFVSAGNTEVNARLNNDIDFSDYPDFPGIGNRENGFKGIFDGGYHTISNMDMSWRDTEEWVGFINFLNGGATVRNLRGDNTCTIAATGNAGFIGGSTAPGDIHLENIGFEGDVTCSRAGAGGVLGCNTASQAKIYMTNCYSTGNISGYQVSENGALSAWLGSNGAVLVNCWSTAVVTGQQNEQKYLARHDNATFTNCYCAYGEQCTIVSLDDVENGALCYKLNGKQEDIVWYQTLDEDEFPTFMPGHKQVYANVEMRCDGTFVEEEATYSNTNGSVRPDHQFVDGFCSVCHQQDPEFPFLNVLANHDHDITTGYQTRNSGGGSGLAINNSVAEHWDMKWFETNQSITGLEPGIYRLRVQGLQRAERWSNEPGHVYESGTISEEAALLYHSSQYFASVNGKKVANRFIDIAEQAQEVRVNETENETVEGLWVPNSLAACNKYFAKNLYWNEPIYFAVESAEDSISIGVENNMYLDGNWTVWDSWRLDKVEGGTAELIRKQQAAAVQDLEGLEPQKSLMEAYDKAKEAIETATEAGEIIALADVLSRTPNLIRKSHKAYKDFEEAIDAIKAERAERDDLYGEATDLLDNYLEEIAEPGEDLPNGSVLYILDSRDLDEEQLAAEAAFAKELLDKAIMTSISEGSDVTNVIKNADFAADGNFKDWVKTQYSAGSEGSNFSSNTGFTDVYPVAGTWNTTFDVHQDIEANLPNGIYRLEAPAFFRPGGNLEGDQDGNDYVTASLYLNDWYTPIKNIYDDRVAPENAINGENGRFDPNDPEVEHHGEATDSYEFETYDGSFIPEKRQAVGFAFRGGRYVNTVYGVVTDGKLTVGIRNTGKPWYSSEMTMWGKFKLTYLGESEEAIDAMMENFQKHKEKLEMAREMVLPNGDIQYNYSLSHISTLETLIAAVGDASGYEDKVAALTALNAEFNKMDASYDAYQDLLSLANYCNQKGDALIEENPEMSDAFFTAAFDIEDHYMEADLTDEDALAYREKILNDRSLGGGYYVQGDLLDEQGENVDYNVRNQLYPLNLNEDGTYTALGVKVQNRANLANSNARAGLFISRMDEVYKATQGDRRFVTPALNEFTLEKGASQDLQMIGGTYNVTFNPATGETSLELVGEYPWHDNVYVVGSIINTDGAQHRWKNDEMAPLAHKGNGIYEGEVTFYQDDKENMYPNFTILACRSNTSAIQHSTTTRGSWNEGRYGSDENKLILKNNVPAGDLLRGQDRKWYMEWGDCTEETQKYTITFDMNNATVKVSNGAAVKGDANGDGEVTIQDVVFILEAMANDATVEQKPSADVNGDKTITIQDVVAVLEIMASL